MSSKVMYGTYTYSYSTAPAARGNIGTAAFPDTSTPPAILVHPQVRATYSSTNTMVIGPDPKPLFFKNGAGLNRAAVASIVWSGGVATCTWLIYEADADNTTPYVWNDPVAGPFTWTLGGSINVTNPYALKTRDVSAGVTDIYFIDYDGRLVFCVRSSGTNGDTYALQTGYYQFPALTSGEATYGVDLDIIGEYVYAVFNSGTNLTSGAPSAVYLNSTVVKLDLSLSLVAYNGPYNGSTSTGVAKNAFSIQAYNDGTTDYLLVAAVGGPQLDQAYSPTYPYDWNPGSRIQSVDPGTLAVTDLLQPAANTSGLAADQFDFRALTFSADGSQAYILTGKYNTYFASFNYRLYWTDMSTILSSSSALMSTLVSASPPAIIVDTNSAASGYLWGLLYSESNVMTWFVKGEDLVIEDVSVPGQVASAGGITALSGFTAGQYPGLNFVTLYEGETAPAAKALKGYVAPAFASVSPAALAERERFLKEAAAAKEK